MLNRKFILYLLIGFVASISHAQNMEKPKVLIITTGGTIASKTDAPLLDGPALVQAMPQLADYADIEVEEFVRIGSSKMTPEIWLDLVKRIDELLTDKPDVTSVIITHGTDSMEETAFFLHLTHRRETPLILVGSMRASNEISADGPANLLNAVRVGVSDGARGKGVLVVMNDNISSGRDLIKMHNRRVDAFPATDLGYIGFVDPETVSFYRAPVKPHTVHSEFNVYDLDSLPEVDIMQDFTGFDSTVLNYFIYRNSDGLVIRSFAGGRLSKGAEEIYKLPANEKPVVVASSIKGGRIMGSGPAGSPVIISNDLPPNKARILLMLALTKTRNAGKIQTYFKKY